MAKESFTVGRGADVARRWSWALVGGLGWLGLAGGACTRKPAPLMAPSSTAPATSVEERVAPPDGGQGSAGEGEPAGAAGEKPAKHPRRPQTEAVPPRLKETKAGHQR